MPMTSSIRRHRASKAGEPQLPHRRRLRRLRTNLIWRSPGLPPRHKAKSDMRPRAPRPDSLQSVTVLEILEALDPQHGEAGVPFKDLETAARSRLTFQGLRDALDALVTAGAAARVCEKPARI